MKEIHKQMYQKITFHYINFKGLYDVDHCTYPVELSLEQCIEKWWAKRNIQAIKGFFIPVPQKLIETEIINIS